MIEKITIIPHTILTQEYFAKKINEIIDELNKLIPEEKEFNPYDLNEVANAMRKIEDK